MNRISGTEQSIIQLVKKPVPFFASFFKTAEEYIDKRLTELFQRVFLVF